jgi:hypothetical protein
MCCSIDATLRRALEKTANVRQGIVTPRRRSTDTHPPAATVAIVTSSASPPRGQAGRHIIPSVVAPQQQLGLLIFP